MLSFLQDSPGLALFTSLYCFKIIYFLVISPELISVIYSIVSLVGVFFDYIR